MITITQYAEKRGISVQTVYSWIYRTKAEENGFRVVQIGKVKMIEEINPTILNASRSKNATKQKKAGKLPVKN